MSNNSHRVIETNRLILRPHELSDFSDIRAMWADKAVVRHVYTTPQTDAESWLRLLRYRGHWDLLGYGYWAVTDKNSGAFLGDVGFADNRRAVEPSFNGMPEAGWVMAAHAHGRGLAREAVEAALVWLETYTGAPITVAMISQNNEQSLRFARALGYRKLRNCRHESEDMEIWERNQPS